MAPRAIDLNETIGNTKKMLGRLLGEDIELVFEPTRPLPKIMADPGQVEQVVMNLAVNARDAMSEGGALTIETDMVALDQDYAKRKPGVSPGRYAMIAVTAQEDVAQQATARTRRRTWNWWAGLCGAAAAFIVGYGAMRIQTGRADRLLLQDLPVIESIDEYRYAGDLQFLELLDDSGLFAEEEEIEDELHKNGVKNLAKIHSFID